MELEEALSLISQACALAPLPFPQHQQVQAALVAVKAAVGSKAASNGSGEVKALQ